MDGQELSRSLPLDAERPPLRADEGGAVRVGKSRQDLAGDSQPPEVHALVAAMNASLGNVGQSVAELHERSGDPDVVVVDPPRAGLAGKALKRLGETGAPRIVYVSCNPTTLAGDVKRLADDYGYRLLRATPVDMFPHTPHVETVALLERQA